MPKRATIKDVASAAGVSLKTVSRVINREPGVSEQLTERVHQAIATLGYRHNLAASNLRRGQRTQSIGVLLHDLRNAFSATLLGAVEDRARQAGIAVVSASLDDDDEREASVVSDLVARRVDGLVLMPTGADQTYLGTETQAGLAVVVVDRPATGVDVDTVLVDNEAGAHEAARHLASYGHHRIACLADRSSIWTSEQRRAGFLRGLADAGVAADEGLVIADLPTTESAIAAVLALFDRAEPPTALFTARNALSVGAIRALRLLGLQREVALVGFDDFPMADLVDPGITVVAQDVTAIGQQAAELLLDRLAGSTAAPKRLELQTSLVVRGSGEVHPHGSTG